MKMRLIANYTMQNVAFYLTKYLGENLVDIKAKLQKFNEFLIKNMPKISAAIAKGLYVIVRLAETLVVTIGKIVTMVMDFFQKLPPAAKASLLALAALGFAAIVELFEVTKRYRWLFFGLGAGLIVGLLARWLRG